MRLFLDDDDDITWLLAWILIGFSVEGILAIIWRTLVDRDLNDLSLFFEFSLIDLVASSLAFRARSLRLRVHARSELNHLGDDTTASASGTLLNGTRLISFTVGIADKTLSIDGNFGGLAIVNFFQSAF